MVKCPFTKLSTAVAISVFAILAKNPKRPMLMPMTGMPESLTKVRVSNMVPSPPILTKQSTWFTKS